MSKRMKALIAVVVAILVLTVGGTAVVMAQDEPTPTPEAGANGLLARVAEILDIPQEDLTSAFKQAQQEIRQETFLRFLDKAVEEERITQEEADEYLEWWEQRPEVCDRLMQRARICNAIRDRQMQQQGTLPMRGSTTWGSPKGPRGWHSTAPPWLAE